MITPTSEEAKVLTITEIGLVLSKDTSSEKLKELYLTTKHDIIKELIVIHPNCPEELKVVIEL